MPRTYQHFKERSVFTRLDGIPFLVLHVALWAKFESEPLVVLSLLTHGFVFLAAEWWTPIRKAVRLSPCSAKTASIVLVCPSDPLKMARFCRVQIMEGQPCIDFERKMLVYREGGTQLVRRKLGLRDESKSIKELISHNLSHYPTDMNLPTPEFIEILKEQVKQPLFVFQIVCVLLWLLDEYWYYALLTLFLLVFLEVQNTQRRISELREVRRLKPPPVIVTAAIQTVQSAVAWHSVSSAFLLPGNKIKIDASLIGVTLPVDLLLLTSEDQSEQATLKVSEEMLTGEDAPVTKLASASLDDRLCLSGAQKHSVLLAGTRILDIRMEGKKKDRVTVDAVVLNTGFETTQGKLVRTILYSKERMTAAGNQDAWRFLLSMLFFAVIAAGYVLHESLNDRPHPRSSFKIFLSISHIITSVVPPEFPLILSITVTLSLLHLQRNHSLHSTEPYRLLETPKVQICCFDKTGTLTAQALRLHSVVALPACDMVGDIAGLVINDGDPMEEAARRTGALSDYEVLAKFPFDSELRRSSVVVRRLATRQLFVFGKGASEHKDARQLASQGLRVIGLFCKSLDSEALQSRIRREDAERDLQLVGFAAFSSALRPAVKRTITRLKNSGRECVMITGDHLLTSVHVAQQAGILAQQTGETDASLLVSCDVAGWKDKSPSEFGKAKVFARAKPQDKEYIVSRLEAETGRCVMVGDGTNDVGALKQAAVGIAVVDGSGSGSQGKSVDASIAAPFVYSEINCDINCVDLLLRAGSAVHATVVQSYKILAVNSLIGAFCLSVLTLNGVKLKDSQTAIESLFISLVSLLASKSPPSKKLVKPVSSTSVFTIPLMLNLVAQAVFHAGLLHLGQQLLKTGSVSSDNFLDTPYEPSVGNSVAFLQVATAHITTYMVNLQGPPALPSLRDNRPLRNALLGGLAVVVLAASELFPPVNDLFSLESFSGGTGTDYRWTVVGLVAAHVLGPLGIASLHS